MSHRIAAAPIALILLSGPVVAQSDPPTVGISVEGTVVEVAVEVAAQACGLEAEAILAEWKTLETEISTMADTTVAADMTDLAPAVEVDTQMDAAIDGVTVTDGADATHEGDGDAAQDIASDVMSADGSPSATDEGAEATAEADSLVDSGSEDAGAEATADAATESADDPASADIATEQEMAASVTDQAETGGLATPTAGTVLSKAAVCEISRETAGKNGISVPG